MKSAKAAKALAATLTTTTGPPRILETVSLGFNLISLFSLSFFCILLIFLCCLYKQYRDRRIHVYYNRTSRNKAIVGSIKPLLNEYNPTLWLPGSFMKIMFNGFSNSKKKQEVGDDFYRRMNVELEDGEVIALDVHPQRDHFDSGKPYSEKARTIIFVPGIFGHSLSIGCSQLSSLAWERLKWRTVIFNRRGYSNMPIKSDRITSFDIVSDLKQVVDYVRREYDDAPVYLVGISVGAAQIQKYLQTYGEHSGVSGAVCTAVPWDVKETGRKISSSSMVEKAMVFRAKKFVKKLVMNENLKKVLKAKKISFDKILSCKTKREVDEELYVKDTGAGSVEEYYEGLSTHTEMEKVKCPLLCVNSLDDPVSAYHMAPLEKIGSEGYEHWIQVNTGGGGHVEFFSGFCPERWIYRLVLQYLKSVDSVLHQNKSTGRGGMSEA